jgi:MOSC domain-containing protein YiiM
LNSCAAPEADQLLVALPASLGGNGNPGGSAVPRIFQINVSQGGVPKLALPHAEVTADGLAGDKQADRKHHGGPQRAVCLYSLERILALQEEGHPVFPGAAGENLTVVGLDWGGIAPGQQFRLGPEVVVEIVSYTPPCATIRHCFRGQQQNRISQKHNPGWSRVYARVLQSGRIGVGDAIARV